MDRAEAVRLVMGLCLRFEGLYREPYLCPAGVATIGVGATHYLDGRRVTLKDPPITREHALVLLREMIQKEYLPAVDALCAGARTPQQVAALTDFCYNLGVGQLRMSTLRRRVNRGQWDLVPAELRKWVRGGGRVLKGLVRRREAEVALIS